MSCQARTDADANARRDGEIAPVSTEQTANSQSSSTASDDLHSTAPELGAIAPELRSIAEWRHARSETESKLSTGLLLEAQRLEGRGLLGALPRLQSRVTVSSQGDTKIEVRGRITGDLKRTFSSLGGTVSSAFPQYGTLTGRLPVASLLALGAHPDVDNVRPQSGFLVSQSDVSEGSMAHRADAVRQALSVDGNGFTVGVISDGVDSLAQIQSSADLPSGIQLQVLPGLAGFGDEGTAMLEIVHDVAPGANLLFATAGESDAAMANSIDQLRLAGCDIIVDDVLFLSEPTFQDGIVAQAVSDAIDAGVLYFSSAGNSGNELKGTSGTYEGDFQGIALPQAVVDYPGEVWQDAHSFGGLVSNAIQVDPPAVIILEWADPLQGSGNDYDLFLLSPDGQDVLALSAESQDGTGDPYEAISSTGADDRENTVVVARWGGEARFLHVATHRGGLAVSTDGQINGHPAVDGVFAIAAVDVALANGEFQGGDTNPVEDFSSDGPRRMFFTSTGTALTPGNFSSSGGAVRQKPDFTAADGVVVATPGFSPFFGTSAAAPHAAALAALVLQARPTIANQTGAARSLAMRQAFAQTALDVEAPGFDTLSGYGLLMADAALAVCADQQDGSPCDDRNACTDSDRCENEECVGDAVVCQALDTCHLIGECDPTTGCQQPEAPNGSVCDDEDACTGSSSCQAGGCVGQEPVECPEDDCFEAGACDPSTGECTRSKKADDSGCDDDTDAIANGQDNCPEVTNPGQENTDGDSLGDACDPDDDDDGVSDADETLAGTDPLDPNDVPDTSEGEGGSSGGMAGGGMATGGQPTAGSGGSGIGGSSAGGSAFGGNASGGTRTTGGTGGRSAVGEGGQRQMPNQAEPGGGGEQSGPVAAPDGDAGTSLVDAAKTPNEGCGCRLNDSGDRRGLLVLGVLAFGWALRRRSRAGSGVPSSTRCEFQGD